MNSKFVSSKWSANDIANYASNTSQNKCYTFISALYLTIFLTTVILSRKLIQIDSFILAGATFIVPVGFFLGDVIAEVYGYYAARYLLWVYIICGFIFSTIMELAAYASPPSFWPLQDAYISVLGNSLQISLASAAGLLLGGIVNAFAISKWKVLLKGRLFWVRSLGASSIGELTFVLVALPLSQYNNHMVLIDLIKMMCVSYFSKLIFSCFVAIPGNLMIMVLKKFEHADVYDYDLKFNPFSSSNLDR